MYRTSWPYTSYCPTSGTRTSSIWMSTRTAVMQCLSIIYKMNDWATKMIRRFKTKGCTYSAKMTSVKTIKCNACSISYWQNAAHNSTTRTCTDCRWSWIEVTRDWSSCQTNSLSKWGRVCPSIGSSSTRTTRRSTTRTAFGICSRRVTQTGTTSSWHMARSGRDSWPLKHFRIPSSKPPWTIMMALRMTSLTPGI